MERETRDQWCVCGEEKRKIIESCAPKKEDNGITPVRVSACGDVKPYFNTQPCPPAPTQWTSLFLSRCREPKRLETRCFGLMASMPSAFDRRMTSRHLRYKQSSFLYPLCLEEKR